MRTSMKSVPGLLALLILALACCAMEVVAAPYQELPPRAGHIPVYIREDNQPLSEIHPGLAEAFHELGELDQKGSNSKTVNSLKDQTDGSKDEKETNRLLNTIKPTESDIASFDVVKNVDAKIDSLSNGEVEKQETDIVKKDDKEQDKEVA
ncbi:uncharacterized protein LOC128859895 [Anastrepha ludens]|uniref:uncharacterized protein LOC128859895 n=1 Tax=Anastrepha ludens TaxID=28586 RepID=UPI0023B1E058|nr:uncharacterized protein LOC128859895 [Anastrepha ludens]